MSQPLRIASPSETPEIPTLHALPAAPPAPLAPPQRELEALTPEVSQLICDFVRKEGISERSAAALLLVNAATLARWKAEHEFFVLQLSAAREEFELMLIREIRTARKRDGSPDWHARAWLLKHTTAEGIVRPGQTKSAPAKQPSEPAQNNTILPETPARPAAPPMSAARENRTNRPETPGRPATVPGNGGAAGAKAAILPETPNARREAAAV